MNHTVSCALDSVLSVVSWMLSPCPTTPCCISSSFCSCVTLCVSQPIRSFWFSRFDFFFVCVCHDPSLYSQYISLMLNVILPFFRLWFWWHLPCVAVIAKCRLGRWDIGQPLPPSSFYSRYVAWFFQCVLIYCHCLLLVTLLDMFSIKCSSLMEIKV